MSRSFRLSLILAALFAVQAFAAAGWDRLSDLHMGDRVTVLETDRSEHRGEFVSVSPSALTIRTGGNERTIPRARIARVQSPAKSKWLRNAAIGAAIGVAAAVTTDRTLGVRLNNEGGYSSGAKAAVWTVPIAVGGAIGALTGRSSTIYKAPR
jgi:hypothetical protein